MDGFLRALFLDKGFTEDQLDTIEAQDSELRHVGDLAAGATSEDDARVWAEELGLNSRVSKSRFVRSWIEARSQGSMSLDAGYAPSEPAKRAPSPVQEPPVESKFVEEELADDWNWVKLSSQAEMAMTPTPQQETRVALSYIDGEPVSKPGGISDMLRSSLRSHGLTSIEVIQMEQTLEARSCKALATAASTFESAMRLARLCGIQSKVSQENFAKAWHQAAATMIALDGGKKSKQLVELVKDEDWEACTKLLMQRCQVSKPKELLPLLRGLLHQLAERQRLKVEAQSKAETAKVLPTLASLYGPEAVAEAEKSTAMAQAEWRYSWMVRSFFTVRTLASLQAEVLNAYEAEEFQAACEALNKTWVNVDRMPLDQKMRAIEALCLEHALKRILPRYGFKADADGMAEMKQVVTEMSKLDTEVRRRQMLITAAVMKKFKL